jgi:hypothetical protein
MQLKAIFAKGFALSALGAMTLLGSCADELRRSDTISQHAGEFMAADLLAQEVDPWPAAGFERRQPLDGQKAMAIVKTYRQGSGAAPASGASPATAASSTQGGIPN